MNWAFKNRIIYLGTLLIILLIVFSLPIYKSLNKTPTCFDGKKNGGEIDVDCGGGCLRVCEISASDLKVLWSRSFEVRDGLYNSMAMIENSNVTSGAMGVPYVFKLFDERNVLVYERKGTTNIPAQTRFPIFESDIVVGERVPYRTFFEFGEKIDWFKQENIVSDIRIKDQKITDIESAPKIEVIVENRGLNKIKNLGLYVVVYDSEDNAMAGSNTFIANLNPNSTETVVFTWPTPFSRAFGKVEVIPKFDTSI